MRGGFISCHYIKFELLLLLGSQSLDGLLGGVSARSGDAAGRRSEAVGGAARPLAQRVSSKGCDVVGGA